MTGSCCTAARRPSSRSASIGEAARLAAAVAAIEGFEGSGAVLTIVDASLTVRLTRDLWQLESAACRPGAGGLGGRIGARRGRRPRIGPGGAARDRLEAGCGGRRLLARRARLCADGRRRRRDPLGHGSTVWMQELDEAKPLRHAMHVDVSVAREHVEGRLAAALAAGGRVVWESDEHWTLADRAGNRV